MRTGRGTCVKLFGVDMKVEMAVSGGKNNGWEWQQGEWQMRERDWQRGKGQKNILHHASFFLWWGCSTLTPLEWLVRVPRTFRDAVMEWKGHWTEPTQSLTFFPVKRTAHAGKWAILSWTYHLNLEKQEQTSEIKRGALNLQKKEHFNKSERGGGVSWH